MEALDLGDSPLIPCQNVDQGFYASGDSFLNRVSGFATLPMCMNQDCDCPPQTVDIVKVASSLLDI